MRVLASITLSIFYCWFLSSSENVRCFAPEIGNDQSPSYAKEVYSLVKKSVAQKKIVKQAAFSEPPMVSFTAFVFVVLLALYVSLLHPRTLRIKSGLSPPF